MKREVVSGMTSLWPIMQLSYVEQSCRLRIIEDGKRYFGDRFKPITEITQFNDYVGVLHGCAFLTVDYLRQQAAGNLIISLFLGVRVYLNPKTALYEGNRNQGLVLNNIKDLPKGTAIARHYTGQKKIGTNRQTLKSFKGCEAHEPNTEQVIRALAGMGEQKAPRRKGYH